VNLVEKKRIEDPGEGLRIHAHAVVLNGQLHVIARQQDLVADLPRERFLGC